MSKPRIWISNAKPKAGELVRMRALVEHRMESGLRLNKDRSGGSSQHHPRLQSHL